MNMNKEIENDDHSELEMLKKINFSQINDRKPEENGDSNDEDNDGNSDDEENDVKSDDEENDVKSDDDRLKRFLENMEDQNELIECINQNIRIANQRTNAIKHIKRDLL
jgi:hypothetical protein